MSQTHESPSHESPPRTPRWVKLFGIVLLVLVLLIVIMIASGHNPGRHMSGGSPGGQPSISTIIPHAMQQP